MDAAGGSVREGMGDAASVADYIQTAVLCFQIAVELHFNVIEFHVHAVE